ncbi:SDR family NAD(P)-dependent oxidoreductase [Streptomyces sp. NPDC093250]|uniref:SDR family NAD(P)-dependent oxidoreductase n=1 Tax=Streptomyces sp. NPDC093250 TaxID=3366036 RepID=UPI003805EACB
MSRLAGRAALVTGGTGGMGRAVVDRLASEGARVGVADLDYDLAVKVAEEVGGVPLAMDVRSAESVAAGFERFVAEAGGLDVLVTCAGVVDPRPLDQVEPEEWSFLFDVNVRGTWLCSKEALKHMRSGGSIITVGSRAGLVGGTTSGASYAASKAAVICFTKSLAKFAASRGIRANVVNPGCIETPMLEHFAEDVRAAMPGQAALKRLGRPDEIASVVAFLAGEDSSYMTGSQLNVNGGSHM